MEIKLCEYCKKEFKVKKPWQKYCSPVCGRKIKWIKKRILIEKKTCLFCGKEFTPQRKRKNEFCSNLCRSKHVRKNIICSPSLLKCQHCELFFYGRKNKKYCSQKCSRSAAWLRQKNNPDYAKHHLVKAIEYQKNHPEIERARRILQSKKTVLKNGGYTSNSKYSKKEINIIYECYHNHPKKHLHHPDYSKPFEVMKLCPSCHREEHSRKSCL